MWKTIRNIIAMGGILGGLCLLPGTLTGEAHQIREETSQAQSMQAVVSSAPTPAPTPTQEVEIEYRGPMYPSGKRSSYYDTVEPTYIDGVLLVNKEYALPRDYGDGEDPEAYQALLKLQRAAKRAGYSLSKVSGFRSFELQEDLFERYSDQDGEDLANTYSAWPGHSEHQTGLAFDVGWISDYFATTGSGRWLASHAHEYGFIIRYPKGKEDITGYKYEPWHIRYLGKELATQVYESGLCLEEFLGVG